MVLSRRFGDLDVDGITNLTNGTVVGDTLNTYDDLGVLNCAGDVVLQNTVPRVLFKNNGVGAPTFTNRSAGTKIVLIPSVSGSAVDFAIGIESSVTWFSVPTTSQSFKFYGGTTEACEITGAGNLNIAGALKTTYTQQDYISLESNTTTQSISNNSVTTVTHAGTTKGTASTSSTKPTESSGIITINSTGLYMISYALFFDNNDITGWRGAWIDISSSSGDRLAASWVAANPDENTALNGSITVTLSATNTFKIQVFQNSGSAINLLSGINATVISCVKLF